MSTEGFERINSIVQDNKYKAEVGLEGFRDVGDFLEQVYLGLVKDWRPRIQNMSPYNLTVGSNDKLARKLDGKSQEDLDPITVYHPQGFNEFVLPYANFISTALDQVANLDTRILIPLTKYLQRIVSNPEAIDEVWVAKDVSYADVEKLTKEMAKFFDKRIRQGDRNDKAAFSELYGSKRDFTRTGEVLAEAKKKADSIDLGRLKKAEQDLFDTVKLYIELVNDGKARQITNRQAIKKVTHTVSQAVQELEFISVLLFNLKTMHVAYSDSVEKLEDNLS